MPQPPEQPDPKEAVEARLCAYLEGDLTGEERSQIERHLADSPPHRKLLAELAAVRGWTQQLPREPAPPDLSEAFQQQVERALLLDPAGRRGGGGRRWLVAAVLLVTAGGAAVVSTVLLRRPAGQPSVAVRTPTTRADPATVPLSAGETLAVDQPAVGLGAVPPADGEVPGGTQAAAAAAAAAEPSRQLADVLAAAGVQPTDANRVVELVVVTAAPDAAVGRAVGFLRDSRLAWDGPAAGVAPAVRTQVAAMPSAPSVAQRNAPQVRSQTTTGAGNLYANATVGDERNASAPEGRSANNGNAVGGRAPPAVAPASSPASSPATDGQVLFVRDVTPAQFRDLSAALSTGGATVRSVDVPPTLTGGEELDVTIPQLVGPGVERTNVVRVATDGTVTLPMLAEPVPATGGTAADLERRVADRYRSANLIPAAKVSIAPHAKAAALTTHPAGSDRVTVVVVVRAPATTRE